MRRWLAELVASDFGCLAISKHFGGNGQPALRAKAPILTVLLIHAKPEAAFRAKSTEYAVTEQ